MNNFFQSKSNSLSKKDRTRAAIIDGAIDVLSKKGYQNSSIKEMAEKAGIANGTFYNHYKDRKSIFDEVGKLIAIELTKTIEENESNTKDPAQKIINSTKRFIERSVQVPDWGIIFLEAYDYMPIIRNEVSKYLVQDIKRGIKIKIFKISYDEFVVEQIIVLILHAIRKQLKNGYDNKIINKTTDAIMQLLNHKK
ncbi:TetR/AcrR family transcriptional regulator [Pelagibacterales bacterium]|nr:TetR/AcrR family transcriptional regulator [Pelagibacterales bacterium]